MSPTSYRTALSRIVKNNSHSSIFKPSIAHLPRPIFERCWGSTVQFYPESLIFSKILNKSILSARRQVHFQDPIGFEPMSTCLSVSFPLDKPPISKWYRIWTYVSDCGSLCGTWTRTVLGLTNRRCIPLKLTRNIIYKPTNKYLHYQIYFWTPNWTRTGTKKLEPSYANHYIIEALMRIWGESNSPSKHS